MPGSHRSSRRPIRLIASNITGLVLTLALAFGQFGIAPAGATDRDREGSFSSDTEVITTDGSSGGGSGGSSSSVPGGGVPTRDSSPVPQPRHGGSSVPVNFEAAAPASYSHSTGAAGAGFGFANTVSTLNGGDFQCGDKVVFLVEVHAGDAYSGVPVTAFGYSFAKQPTGQPGAGYTDIGAPSLLTGDAAYDDDGTGASISNVSIGSTATHHTLSFDISGIDGQLAAPDADGDTIILRMTATLGCTPGATPTGQIQANQTGNGGNDTVNLNVAGLSLPAALSISKAVTAGGSVNVGFGQNISWTITVTNSGGSAATNVVVTDTLPTTPAPGFTLFSITPSAGGSCVGTVCTFPTIAAGASATVVVVATAPNRCGSYTNTATGTADPAATPIPASAPGAHQVTGTVTGCLAAPVISKAVTGGGSSNVNQGANTSWTITVSNATGTAPATNVVVTDTLPAGFVLFSLSSSQGTCTNATVSCNLGTIAAGASATVTVVATAPATCGPYTNTATGTYGTGSPIPAAPGAGNVVGGNVINCPAGTPAPVISKAVTGGGSADVTFSQNISWTITVSNAAGTAPATNVVVTDTLPAGFVLFSLSSSQGTCTNATVSCNLGTIAAGASATVTVVATAPATCGPYTNTATGTFGAAAPVAIPASGNQVSGDVTGCAAAPVISKAVTGGGSVDVTFSQNISWTITVSNAAGNAAAANVSVTDTLPPGFVLFSITPSQGSCVATTCNLGTIAAGASATIVVVATAPSTCGPYTNTATGTFGAAGPTPIPPLAAGANSVSGNVTGCTPNLTLGKAGPATVGPGGSITWTVTVTNSGNADALGVAITDTLPAGFTFVSSNPGAPTCTEAGGIVSCTVDVLKLSSTSISITATAPSTCGPFTNTATMGLSTATASGNVTGCGPLPVPAITTFKAADAAVVASGDSIGFTITVRSTGTGDALQVKLGDSIPSIPGVASWTIDGGSGAGLCSLVGLTLSCSFGNMAPGAQFDVHISSTATTNASCGSYTNTATATALNAPSSSASASVRVDCPPAVSGIDVTKTGPATAKVGDTVTYNFTVALAPGSPDLTGVTITDPICDPGTLAGPTGDDGDSVLEAGETWGFSCTHVVTASDPDPLPNTVTVCATGPAGATVCDNGNHEIDITHPAIDVEKEADPTSGSPGDVITFTYFVTNSGDVPLFDVSVDDDVLGHICDIAVLPPNTTVTCTGTYTIPAGAAEFITNIVIAGGTDPAGDLVEDQDDFTITIVAGETITKSPPGGVAFTGPATAIPFATLALVLLTLGSGLLWLGRRRERERTDGPEA